MKKTHKILIGAFGFISLFVAWACGVGMGRVYGDKASAHNMMVHSFIILDHIERGEPDKAANWCKGFIVDGSHGRSRNASPVTGFLYFMRHQDLPELSDTMNQKIQHVTESYKPTIVDLGGYKVERNSTGFSVEIPTKKQSEQAAPSNR